MSIWPQERVSRGCDSRICPADRALVAGVAKPAGLGHERMPGTNQPFRELLHDSIAADGSVRISKITLHSGRSASTMASQILVNISAMPNP
jgi:hypothetical protein